MFYSKKLKNFKNIKHCFFSRHGGFSKGLYKGLNCGRGSKDTWKAIEYPKVCPVLRIELDWGMNGRQPNSPSLDRINPRLGYVKGNVEFVANIANMMMSSATGKDIKKFVNYINIKEHLNNLSFIEKNKRKIYGLYFQGGVCKTNKQSYEYIIKQS